jgi:LysW-gamma-L-lysine carboxypeptidase
MVRWAEAFNAGKTARFDTLDPSLRDICSENDAFQEWVEMQIGFRLPPGLPLEDLQAEVEVQKGEAEIERLNCEPPFRAEKSNVLCGTMLYAIRAEGGQPAFVYKTGTSDMNVVGPVWNCPIIAYGPGDSSLDHTPDEHTDLEEYLRAIHVLTRALQRLAA